MSGQSEWAAHIKGATHLDKLKKIEEILLAKQLPFDREKEEEKLKKKEMVKLREEARLREETRQQEEARHREEWQIAEEARLKEQEEARRREEWQRAEETRLSKLREEARRREEWQRAEEARLREETETFHLLQAHEREAQRIAQLQKKLEKIESLKQFREAKKKEEEEEASRKEHQRREEAKEAHMRREAIEKSRREQEIRAENDLRACDIQLMLQFHNLQKEEEKACYRNESLYQFRHEEPFVMGTSAQQNVPRKEEVKEHGINVRQESSQHPTARGPNTAMAFQPVQTHHPLFPLLPFNTDNKDTVLSPRPVVSVSHSLPNSTCGANSTSNPTSNKLESCHPLGPVLESTSSLSHPDSNDIPELHSANKQSSFSETTAKHADTSSLKQVPSDLDEEDSIPVQCGLCGLFVRNRSFWGAHVDSPKHKRKITKENSDHPSTKIPEENFYCNHCKVACVSEKEYSEHLAEDTHRTPTMSPTVKQAYHLSKEDFDLRLLIKSKKSSGELTKSLFTHEEGSSPITVHQRWGVNLDQGQSSSHTVNADSAEVTVNEKINASKSVLSSQTMARQTMARQPVSSTPEPKNNEETSSPVASVSNESSSLWLSRRETKPAVTRRIIRLKSSKSSVSAEESTPNRISGGGVTASPSLASGGGVTASPSLASGGRVTASPGLVSGGRVTASPSLASGGRVTASPSLTSGGGPGKSTIKPVTSVKALNKIATGCKTMDSWLAIGTESSSTSIKLTNQIPSPKPTNSVPVTTGKNPVANAKSPVTTGKSPVTIGKNPMTTGKNPVANAKSPVTTGKNPVANAKSPVTTGKNPVANAKSPVTTGKNPVANAKSPVTTGKNPVANAKSPVTTGKNPVANAKSPVTTGKNPVASGKNPVTTAKSPVTTGKNPVITAKSPVTNTKSPMTTAKNPVTTGKNPITKNVTIAKSPVTTVKSHVTTVPSNQTSSAIQSWLAIGTESSLTSIRRTNQLSSGKPEIETPSNGVAGQTIDATKSTSANQTGHIFSKNSARLSGNSAKSSSAAIEQHKQLSSGKGSSLIPIPKAETSVKSQTVSKNPLCVPQQPIDGLLGKRKASALTANELLAPDCKKILTEGSKGRSEGRDLTLCGKGTNKANSLGGNEDNVSKRVEEEEEYLYNTNTVIKVEDKIDTQTDNRAMTDDTRSSDTTADFYIDTTAERSEVDSEDHTTEDEDFESIPTTTDPEFEIHPDTPDFEFYDEHSLSIDRPFPFTRKRSRIISPPSDKNTLSSVVKPSPLGSRGLRCDADSSTGPPDKDEKVHGEGDKQDKELTADHQEEEKEIGGKVTRTSTLLHGKSTAKRKGQGYREKRVMSRLGPKPEGSRRPEGFRGERKLEGNQYYRGDIGCGYNAKSYEWEGGFDRTRGGLDRGEGGFYEDRMEVFRGDFDREQHTYGTRESLSNRNFTEGWQQDLRRNLNTERLDPTRNVFSIHHSKSHQTRPQISYDQLPHPPTHQFGQQPRPTSYSYLLHPTNTVDPLTLPPNTSNTFDNFSGQPRNSYNETPHPFTQYNKHPLHPSSHLPTLITTPLQRPQEVNPVIGSGVVHQHPRYLQWER